MQSAIGGRDTTHPPATGRSGRNGGARRLLTTRRHTGRAVREKRARWATRERRVPVRRSRRRRQRDGGDATLDPMCVIRSVSDASFVGGDGSSSPSPLDRFVSHPPTACPSPRAAPDSSTILPPAAPTLGRCAAFRLLHRLAHHVTGGDLVHALLQVQKQGSEPAEVRQHALAVVLDRDVGLRHAQLHLHDGAVGGAGATTGVPREEPPPPPPPPPSGRWTPSRWRRGGGGERGVRFVREGRGCRTDGGER